MSNIKIKDIAKAAGVCEATVSRTLRNPDIVSEKTRKKVLAVVEQMDYTPNSLGASLRQGSSRNILVMLPDITNPYFSPIVRAIEQEAIAKRYSVLLGDTLDDPKLEHAFANMVRSRQADGVIINSQRIPFDYLRRPEKASRLPPIVSASEIVDEEEIPRVVVDNVEVGRTATRHLLELGHRRIGLIAGPADLRTTKDRMLGFHEEMQKAGLKVDPQAIFYGDYSTESGIEGVQKLMLRPDRPTALFCLGDLVALGALHILRELGFRVPDDISVIGVDGISMGRYSAPPLTTVAQPMEQIGKTCMATMIDLIEGRAPENKLILLPHELIIRKTTGPAPA